MAESSRARRIHWGHMRPVAIPLFVLLATSCLGVVACGSSSSAKAAAVPTIPMHRIAIVGPRQVIQSLDLGALNGLVLETKEGGLLDEEWTVHAKANDEGMSGLAARGCTAEHRCTVRRLEAK